MATVTLNDLDQRVLSKIDYNTALYQTPERYAAINEAAQCLNVLTAFSQISVQLPIPTQSNRIWYDVPYNLVIPTRVQIDGKYLKRSSLLQKGRLHKTWVTENTANQVTPVSQWIPFGIRKFGIWPADSCGGRQLVVTGIAEIPPLVNPTDTLQLQNDLLAALDILAVLTLLLKVSPKEFSDASIAYQQFLRIVKRMTFYQKWKAPAYFVAELQQPQKRG